jgi:hypothetical protein
MILYLVYFCYWFATFGLQTVWWSDPPPAERRPRLCLKGVGGAKWRADLHADWTRLCLKGVGGAKWRVDLHADWTRLCWKGVGGAKWRADLHADWTRLCLKGVGGAKWRVDLHADWTRGGHSGRQVVGRVSIGWIGDPPPPPPLSNCIHGRDRTRLGFRVRPSQGALKIILKKSFICIYSISIVEKKTKKTTLGWVVNSRRRHA